MQTGICQQSCWPSKRPGACGAPFAGADPLEGGWRALGGASVPEHAVGMARAPASSPVPMSLPKCLPVPPPLPLFIFGRCWFMFCTSAGSYSPAEMQFQNCSAPFFWYLKLWALSYWGGHFFCIIPSFLYFPQYVRKSQAQTSAEHEDSNRPQTIVIITPIISNDLWPTIGHFPPFLFKKEEFIQLKLTKSGAEHAGMNHRGQTRLPQCEPVESLH